MAGCAAHLAGEMNDIYARYFNQPWPAPSIVVAVMVPPELLFVIEAIAHRRKR
ncbi:hypothetical protein [Streptomyces sp. NPDC057636]|uniref:hypothetical protein n=1 Tax=Streptomyces sp. NPDC057636 TaxID=3346189 RepID=UPI00368411EB